VQHQRQGETGVITLPVEKRILASMLGMRPENLSRAFATLKPYGVAVEGTDIRMHKIGDLQTLAKPTESIDGL